MLLGRYMVGRREGLHRERTMLLAVRQNEASGPIHPLGPKNAIRHAATRPHLISSRTGVPQTPPLSRAATGSERGVFCLLLITM